VSTAQVGNNTKSQRNWQLTGEFVRDELLNDGLFFPPGTDLHMHPLVQAQKKKHSQKVKILIKSEPER
jgi:hypothetical protein